MRASLGRWMIVTGVVIIAIVVGFAVYVARLEPTTSAAVSEFFRIIVASLPVPGALVVIGIWLSPPERLRRTSPRVRQFTGVLLLLGAVGFLIQFVGWLLDPVFFSDPNPAEIPLLVVVVFASSLPLLLFAGLLGYSGYRLLAGSREPAS